LKNYLLLSFSGDLLCKTIIIGSGPAGLFAGISSAKKGNETIILERNKSAGKKLLLTGAGQCNFTHSGDLKTFSEHYGMKYKQAFRILRYFDNKDFLNFLTANGFDYYERDDGKYFPKSKKASDILDLLLKIFRQSGGKILYNQKVVDLRKDETSFNVITPEQSFSADKVIMANGGITFPNTGSDGLLYKTLQKLGHQVNEPRFGLSPIYVDLFTLSELSGISFKDAGVKISTEGGKSINKRGELLITHRGFSGPVIIDNSRYMKKGDSLEINFTEFLSYESFNEAFLNAINGNGKMIIKSLLNLFNFPKRLTEKILKEIGINETLKVSQLTKETRKLIMNSLFSYPVRIKKIGGINESMVTVGGVDLENIVLSTMESKIIHGLYFCGEIIDMDGDTGGYNIQMAVTTGYLAGNA